MKKMKVQDKIEFPGAVATIQHHRPDGKLLGEERVLINQFLEDGVTRNPAFWALMDLLWEEEVHNVVPTAGRDFLHVQGYSTASGVACGFNYVALSNDTLTETTASTVLSNEIVANGLSRAQGTVAHTNGTNTTTVTKIFTCTTTSQAAQKAALFNASSSGTMCHVLSFTQRTLQVADTLTIVFTITLG